MKKLLYLFLFVCISFFASYSSAQNCPVGEIEDCNGYCAPMEWLMDEICDEQAREYPVGSGYYVDFSCEDFMCDLFACEGCSDECPVGFVPDCGGNCVPGEYIQDGICDMGQRFYKGIPIDFSCQFFGCDMGDCAGSCWDDMGYDGLDDVGACCLGTECSEMTRGECWTLGYTFIGSNTMCLPETCSCGDPLDGLDWVVDCNGECVLLWNVGGGYCSHGDTVDYGDGPFEIDLDCPELACGLSGCVGNCLGGCCTGADCVTVSYYDCVDIGGLFLGSYTECDLAGCVSEQQPIQMPNAELHWSGKLGVVEHFPQWIVSEEDLLVVGAVDNSTFEWKTAICVFRYNESEDEWDEEALLVVPNGWSNGNFTSYTTDGHRIAVTSSMQNEKKIYRNVIDVFAFDGSQWIHEQTIDDSVEIDPGQYNYEWAYSLDILGDVLVVGDPMYNIQPNTDTNHGAAHIYHRDAQKGWAYDATLSPWGDPPFPDGDDRFLGLSVALSNSVVAVASQRSILLYDISGESPEPLQHIRDAQGNFQPRHRSMDFDNNRLMTHVSIDDFGGVVFTGSRIFEFDGADWSATATLVPFDIATGTDWAGYIVDLQGDRAMITSPLDNDLGHRTGSAYIWEFDQSLDGGAGEWIFKSKLWSDQAVGGDEFGIGGALHGSSAYLTGIVDTQYDAVIKVFWPRGISWISPLGGNLSDAINWDPIMPTLSDSVSFSLRSQTSITVGDEFPFKKMLIGPGSYAFDLQGTNRTLNAGQGEAINLQGVHGIIAELKIKGGILQVEGEVYNGDDLDGMPGKIALVSNSAGVMGGIHVDGLYMQHEAGELLIELNTGRPAPGQITGSAPLLGGILELILDDDYLPQDGDIIPLLSSEFVGENSGQFSAVLISDPLPEGLYIKLNYIDAPRGDTDGGTIYAEVDALTNLFGYGDPSSEGIAGEATDVVLADIGSVSGTVDGFDDIVVTTADALHIFLSDGAGGIAGQATYNSPSWNPKLFTSLAAVDAGDLDGDGTIDLAVVNSDTDEFIPIFNESYDINALTIGTPESTGPNPTDVLLVNINAVDDNDDDVVVACYGHTLTDGQIDFFESIPNPLRAAGFTKTGEVLAEGNPINIDPGDVNTDKDIAIYVVLGSGNAVGKMHDDPVGLGFGWAFESFTPVATGPLDIAVGDLTGDNIDDAVVSSPDSDVIGILRGLPGGGFAPSLQLLVGDEPTSVALVDFDNDGDKDIAVIAMGLDSGQREIMMYRNDTSLNGGNLMFASDAVYDSGLSPILVATGDLDGDDHDDLISINEIATYRGISNNMNIRKAVNCSSDFDGSGEVNVADLLEIIALWEAVGDRPQDLDGNGIVNVADLLILIAAWGPC